MTTSHRRSLNGGITMTELSPWQHARGLIAGHVHVDERTGIAVQRTSVGVTTSDGKNEHEWFTELQLHLVGEHGLGEAADMSPRVAAKLHHRSHARDNWAHPENDTSYDLDRAHANRSDPRAMEYRFKD